VTGSADDAAERLAEIIEAHEDGRDDTLELLLELMAVGGMYRWHDNPIARAVWTADLKQYQADQVLLINEVQRLRRIIDIADDGCTCMAVTAARSKVETEEDDEG
jgi:hypothetical protein